MIRTSPVALAFILCCSISPAEPPTDRQVLTAAREAAIEAGLRDNMVSVGERALRISRDDALEDFRAAATMGATRNPNQRSYLDARLAQGLIEAGDPELAAEVLRKALDDIEPQTGEDAGGNRDHWLREKASAICRLAEALAPLDSERARASLESAESALEQMHSDHQRKQALDEYIILLARFEPAKAMERWESELAYGTPDTRILLRMIQADPSSVAQYEDEIAQGSLRIAHPVDLQHVQSALLAARLREDVNAAIRFAHDCRMQHFPPGAEYLGPVADALLEIGVDRLPPAGDLDRLYMRLAEALAPRDLDAAGAVTERLSSTQAQAQALGSIAAGLAATDPDAAREIARDLLARLEDDERVGEAAVWDVTAALGPHDTEVVPSLIASIHDAYRLKFIFAPWWVAHREAAEALVPELTPSQQIAAIRAMVWRGETVLGEDERLVLLREAFELPAFGSREDAATELISQAAKLDPDLAREALGKLPPVDVEQTQEPDLARRAEAILAVADAMERRETGSSGPEVQVLESMIAGAPSGAQWPWLAKAGLANIYAYYDGPLAKATADGVLAALPNAPRGVPTAQVQSAAMEALSRVDMRGTRALFEQDEQLRRSRPLFAELMAVIAARRPTFACEMAMDLTDENMRDSTLREVLSRLAARGEPEAVAEFIGRWLRDREAPDSSLHNILAPLLYSQRPELIDTIPGYLDLVEDPRTLGGVINNTGSGNLVFATDGLLEYLQARYAGIEKLPASHVRPIAAALIERDWAAAEALLEPMNATERAETLLAVLGMRGRVVTIERVQADRGY